MDQRTLLALRRAARPGDEPGGGLGALAGGLALVARGLRRRGPGGLLIAAAGLVLAARGAADVPVLRGLLPGRRIPPPALPAAPRAGARRRIRREHPVAVPSDAVEALLRDPRAVAAIAAPLGARGALVPLAASIGLPGSGAGRVPSPGGHLVAWRVPDGPAAGSTLRLAWQPAPADPAAAGDPGGARVEAVLALDGRGVLLAAGPGRQWAGIALGRVLDRVATLAAFGPARDEPRR